MGVQSAWMDATDAPLGFMPMQAAAAPKPQVHRPDVSPTLWAGALPGGLRCGQQCLDVSDGLLGDLSHILKASGVGARIDTSETTNLIAEKAYLTGASGSGDGRQSTKNFAARESFCVTGGSWW